MNDNLIMEHVFKVSNTQCGGCEDTIVSRLRDVSGVLAAKADIETGEVWVQYDLSRVRFEALPPVVAAAGFPRVFKFSDEHHQDYLWRQKEEALLNEALNNS